MDNKHLSRTRKYDNKNFIIASRAYFQQQQACLLHKSYFQDGVSLAGCGASVATSSTGSASNGRHEPSFLTRTAAKKTQ
jgi:hypothetical protein